MWVREQGISCLLSMALLISRHLCSFGCLFSTALCVVEVLVKCFHHVSPQQTPTTPWWGQALGGKGATWHPLGCISAAGLSLCAPSCRHVGALGLNRKIPMDVGKRNLVVNSFDLNWVHFQKTGLQSLCSVRAHSTPSPLPVLAFNLCASLSKMGMEHSFRGGIIMEKCWYSP